MKLERQVRQPGLPSCDILALSIGLLVPLTYAAVLLAKDTKVSGSSSSDANPQLTTTDGVLETGQASTLSQLTDLPALANPTTYDAMNTLMYTSAEGLVSGRSRGGRGSTHRA